jgi:hypothetical protein
MPGKLISNSVKLTRHEQLTVDFLISHGKSIELLIPGHTQGNKNPDFVMNGLLWEAKSPTTSSFDNLAVTLRRAVKQSPNVVVDIRRMKKPEKATIAFLTQYFRHSHNLKRLIIISKTQPIIELHN